MLLIKQNLREHEHNLLLLLLKVELKESSVKMLSETYII